MNRHAPFEVKPYALYTLAEAAAWLRVSESTARRWTQNGKLRGVRLGQEWRFTGQDLFESLSYQHFTQAMRDGAALDELETLLDAEAGN